ncbi:MAG: hypothetical protein NWP77_00100 [Opitutales bacterium]|nr:hypothetical protein [Opitutales bacterium]MDP4659424.1 hypothetical protein [Opitutales bacterium]MDP4774948.1 hypothetical protein [Opitutales bacterium]MDP4787917.1 hypothetical protein [Opitutales bacterium]MDP4861561.1 hypothetical protein [Opitutales bacterium]
MEFHCPDCGLPIQAADLAPAQGVAVCRFCEKPFPLEACQAAVPFADRNIVPVMTPPKGVDLVETMDGFRLTLSTRSCIAIFLVPFTLVWAGGSLGGIYGTQIAKGEFNWMMSLFGLPFLVGSVALIGLTVMSVAGRTIVELAGGKFSIRTGALGVYRTQSAPWHDVRSCRLTEATRRGRNRYSTSFQVEFKVDGAKDLRLSAAGVDRENALWLARFLAARIQRGR